MSAPLAVPEDLNQNRGRLLRLAESIKTKKKNAAHRSINLKSDPGYSPNIEHLVFGTYRSVTSPPRYDDGAPLYRTASGEHSVAAITDASRSGPGVLLQHQQQQQQQQCGARVRQCDECASIQCDPLTCVCNNQRTASPAVHRGAVRSENSTCSPLRAPHLQPLQTSLSSSTAVRPTPSTEVQRQNSNSSGSGRLNTGRSNLGCITNGFHDGLTEGVAYTSNNSHNNINSNNSSGSNSNNNNHSHQNNNNSSSSDNNTGTSAFCSKGGIDGCVASASGSGAGAAGGCAELFGGSNPPGTARPGFEVHHDHHHSLTAGPGRPAGPSAPQAEGERRRPLTLADQVFLSPLLRNPNSNDPTGILSPPGMFKDNDPTTAIEAAVNRWVGADSRESAELLHQLANIAESRLVRKPPLPTGLGPLSLNGHAMPPPAASSSSSSSSFGPPLPSGLAWNSPCEEPSSILSKSVQIGKPQTPVRAKPATATIASALRNTDPTTDTNSGEHDDYGFAVMYGVASSGGTTNSGPKASTHSSSSSCGHTGGRSGELVELSRARSIPEITGIARGVFQAGGNGSVSCAGDRERSRIGSGSGGDLSGEPLMSGLVDDTLLLLHGGGCPPHGRPRSMHEHMFGSSATARNAAHSLPGLYRGRSSDGAGELGSSLSSSSGAMDLAQLSHLQEPTSHSCNSSPQKILNKFSKTFSLRRNKKKLIEKGYSLESDVPRVNAIEPVHQSSMAPAGPTSGSSCNNGIDSGKKLSSTGPNALVSALVSANGTVAINNSLQQQQQQQKQPGSSFHPNGQQQLLFQQQQQQQIGAQSHGHAQGGTCRVEHSPSLSKDSGIHLNSNSTEETTSSKSGSEDGNSSFNPRRSRALQRSSRRHLRRSQSQPCEINTSSEAEDEDAPACEDGGPWTGANGSAAPADLSSGRAANQTVAYVEALWDHITLDPEELAFRAGEVIRVSDRSDRDWWWGALGANEQRTGWFPANFVRLRVDQENKDGVHGYPQSSTGVQEMSHIRAKVVQELISTEQDFVQHLRDIVEGYLLRCRSRPAMFTAEQVGTIFGNVEQLYVFQKCFLTKLTSCVNVQQPHASCLGDCFLRFRNEFSIYSEYCNNHPLAMAELEQLYRQPGYVRFFEDCRRTRGGMSDISLDGFLLTPVQRICKYPLQLAELLKYTPPGHPDRAHVTLALESMRGVAYMVNERKRRMESLETLEVWQRAVVNWEGPELIETSSLLIHSGDVTRYTLNSNYGCSVGNGTAGIGGIGGIGGINGGAASCNKEVVTMWLFDNVIIYCRREFIRSSLSYRGRIYTSALTLVNIPDGKEPNFGITVKNGFKLYCASTEKWFLFSCRSLKDKTRWLSSFEREREIVRKDKELGYTITENTRKLTRLSILNKTRPQVQGRRGHRPDAAITEALDVEEGKLPPLKDRSGSLPSHFVPDFGKEKKWYHFGSSKKAAKKRV